MFIKMMNICFHFLLQCTSAANKSSCKLPCFLKHPAIIAVSLNCLMLQAVESLLRQWHRLILFQLHHFISSYNVSPITQKSPRRLSGRLQGLAGCQGAFSLLWFVVIIENVHYFAIYSEGVTAFKICPVFSNSAEARGKIAKSAVLKSVKCKWGRN